MYYLKTSADFDSAHFLAGYDGKCANIHGHRWKLEVQVYGIKLKPDGSEKGMLIDFGELKSSVRSLAEGFDHSLIYEKGTLKPATLRAFDDEGFRTIPVPFRPTAENFAKYFYELLSAQELPVRSVTVYETPDNCAVYEEEK